ncbi:MAG: hypothetical protein MUO41_04720 [Methyloceanibacter sp.]|nr:hypothetical protein [Methyloceanibacter sp.]
MSALVCFTVVPDRLRRWEARLGDLSYGIYLNHFLVAALLLWIAEAAGRLIFGMYNKPAFGLFAAIGWTPPKTSRFRRECDSLIWVSDGGGGCGIRLAFSTLMNG